MFEICSPLEKKNFWHFLLWLTTHNRLYLDIPLNPNIMNAYPDDGLLPGLEFLKIIHWNRLKSLRRRQPVFPTRREINDWNHSYSPSKTWSRGPGVWTPLRFFYTTVSNTGNWYTELTIYRWFPWEGKIKSKPGRLAWWCHSDTAQSTPDLDVLWYHTRPGNSYVGTRWKCRKKYRSRRVHTTHTAFTLFESMVCSPLTLYPPYQYQREEDWIVNAYV